MGKPRLIIIIRHAQSEGNQNRQIHQTVPDHRVKLTPDGWNQAYDAGRRLRTMLRPSDTLQFYVSPYRRTRETTDGILETLTSDSPEPSPFSRNAIKVWEEPRLREQDFGNFQPCSAAMERMWQERADYGHFFYRITNGESAADAYDRVSGFNESLWRSFSEDDFPSVCVLVTHGLMTRVFLMKWYHWSVEYFEDLRNVNHCEFVTMTRSMDSGKFLLENKLRTWSELKRRATAAERGEDPSTVTSPTVPARKRWGGCPEGCDHAHSDYPKRAKRRDTKDISNSSKIELTPTKSTDGSSSPIPLPKEEDIPEAPLQPPDDAEDDDEAFPNPEDDQNGAITRNLQHVRSNTAVEFAERLKASQRPRPIPSYIEAGRDFGGTNSGRATPDLDENQDSMDYFPPKYSLELQIKTQGENEFHNGDGKDDSDGISGVSGETPDQEEETRWMEESGMGLGARADALGDHVDVGDEDSEEVTSTNPMAGRPQIEEEEARDKSIQGSVY